MIFVLIMTLWSLAKIALGNFQTTHGLDVQFFNGLASSSFILLALYLAVTALFKLRIEREHARSLQPETETPAANSCENFWRKR